MFQVYPFLLDPRLEAPTEVMGIFGSVWFALDGLAAIPLVLSVGWATVSAGVLPRWFAPASWLMALVAFVMSLGAIFATPAWLAGGGLVTGVGFFAFFAWTFAIGVIFLRLQPQPQ